MKSKLLLLASFACCAAAAVYFMEGLRIARAQAVAQVVNLPTPVLQITPEVGNTNYFVLETNGNTVVSGVLNLSTYIGDSTVIKWFGRQNVGYVISFSTNMVDWEPIRVMIIGADREHTWYDHPNSNRTYRIGCFISPPGNFISQ